MFFNNKTNSQAENTLLVVGLGNIGSQYDQTRHNAGFMVVDELAFKHRANWRRSKFYAEITSFNLGDSKVILAKPTTLMNRSGLAVRSLIDFYKLPLDNLILIYDDVDIDLGKLRIREKGSAGSHNGMKSVVQSLGSKDFSRIRIGTGPKPEYGDMVDFVLGKFTPAERDILDPVIREAGEAVELTAKEDIQYAMNRLAKK